MLRRIALRIFARLYAHRADDALLSTKAAILRRDDAAAAAAFARHLLLAKRAGKIASRIG